MTDVSNPGPEGPVHRVVVTREGDRWLADVPGLPGTHTWSRTLHGLDRDVREAIALHLDLPEGAEQHLAVELDVTTGVPDVDAEAAGIRSERARLARDEARLQERTRILAGQVVAAGLGARDAARLLGISTQRVSQIAPQRSPRGTGRAAGASS